MIALQTDVVAALADKLPFRRASRDGDLFSVVRASNTHTQVSNLEKVALAAMMAFCPLVSD